MRRILLLINDHATSLGPEKQLDEICITVMRHSIQQGYTDGEKQEFYDILRHVLGGVVTLRTPLSIDALSELLLLPSDEIKDTLADLHTVQLPFSPIGTSTPPSSFDPRLHSQ